MTTTVSNDRQKRVEAACENWTRRLIDVSRRNNLLYFRPLKTGTLDLSAATGPALEALLDGEQVTLDSLLGGSVLAEELRDEENGVARKVQEIARRALSNKEEKGLQTMFIAFGGATWPADDGGRPIDAPVVLLPIELEVRGRGPGSITLVGAGPVQSNLVLLHVLNNEFRVEVSAEELLGPQEEGRKCELDEVYLRLRTFAKDVTGFEIVARSVLGNFAFQKMSMVRDLQQLGPQLVNHDMISALAGDFEARQKVNEAQKDMDPRDLDRIPPENEFVVMDADSSQQNAMASVLSGQDAVIHGPPGTGKSQTITNLIASLAATGKRVLFVAEKRAALEVVLDRLKRVGLGHLAIDLHGADNSPRKVLRQVASALELVRSAAQTDCSQLHRRFEERRARLNAHATRMHFKRPPSNETVYELQGKLLRLPGIVRAETRWRGPELNALTAVQADKIRDLLREAGSAAPLFLGQDQSPWAVAVLTDGPSVETAIDLVKNLHSKKWPTFVDKISKLTACTGHVVPKTLNEVGKFLELVRGVQRSFSFYGPSIYTLDLSFLASSLLPGKVGGIRALWAWCRNAELRAARRLLLSLRTDKNVSTAQLAVDIDIAQDQISLWHSFAGGTGLPRLVSDELICHDAFETVCTDLRTLGTIVRRKDFPDLKLSEITEYLERLASDSLTPYTIPKALDVEHQLNLLGVSNLIEEIRTKQRHPRLWSQMFDYCWWTSCLDAARLSDTEIAGFNGRTHDQFVQEFAELDRERVRLAAARVRRSTAERAISAMNAYQKEEDVIRREAQKSRKLLPLRKLFAEAPHVLTALCPCWMASPLSVSQLLDGRDRYFDVVIFDEASQVLPEDAVPAIVRASQVVVAGDANQLPPTAFFVAEDDDIDGAEDDFQTGTSGFESLLDTMNAFVRSRPLDWHYRSRDESLISFSNHHIYGNRMVTFPGCSGSPAITHMRVDQILGQDGEEESSGAEVRKVVELILGHASRYPTVSLGVITMGIKHADRLQRALDQACAERADIAAFFDPNLPERFFIKNLERVQGDERDSIILTIGYGKDRGGNLKFRFGPLLSVGGRRRLNVAITRARQNLTLVSSFDHIDMDPSRVRAGTGVELLRDYIRYAATSGRQFSETEATQFPMNAFEADVLDVLTAQGMTLLPQMGASHFRIDLVAQHPTRVGRHVLAIECDGASYHSSPTARDRDRLRQTQLENLGWRFHRIWSTDWFMRKDEEVRRAVAAFHTAVKSTDVGAALGLKRPFVRQFVTRMARLDKGREKHSVGKRAPAAGGAVLPDATKLREIRHQTGFGALKLVKPL